MKRTINAAWHARHHMPKNPTLQQRVVWHIQHTKHCGCRDVPESIKRATRSV
ncbi:MAG: hypothetical protein AAB402_04505 [Patescibacteria group bacterium]